MEKCCAFGPVICGSGVRNRLRANNHRRPSSVFGLALGVKSLPISVIHDAGRDRNLFLKWIQNSTKVGKVLCEVFSDAS